MNKYRAQKIEVDGIKYDSKKEYRRWQALKKLQKAGEIGALDRQIKYRIEVCGMHICDYIADHVYTEKQVLIVEDVKGFKTPVYRLKKKLMKAVFGVDIREI